jgi:small subunit ribosomal protein S20
LANTSQARKRARQNDKRREHNHAMRATMRTGIKKFLKSVAGKDKDAATTAYRDAVSLLDRMAGRGLTPKNRAARLKSRLNNRLRALS